MRILLPLLVLGLSACSASPDYTVESEDLSASDGVPAAVDVDEEPAALRVCAPEIEERDRELSSAIWDVVWSCEDPDVVVEFAEDLGETTEGERVGGVSLGGRIVLPQPPPNGRWLSLPFALAHELGHEIGWDHPCSNGEPSDAALPECTDADRCSIMFPRLGGMDRECILANAGLT